MKKISLMLGILIMSIIAVAQDFETQMLDKTKKIEQDSISIDLLKLSTEFETLAINKPDRFEAKYYQALCLVFNSFGEKDKIQKDAQLDKAERVLIEAEEQSPQNAELYLLHALCYQMKIDVDPQKRGYEFSGKANQELEKAFKIDSKNPRYYFLKGQNIFYTPIQYGGGKKKAKPYFEKAAKLFKKFKRKNVLDPIWGKKTNAQQLEACK